VRPSQLAHQTQRNTLKQGHDETSGRERVGKSWCPPEAVEDSFVQEAAGEFDQSWLQAEIRLESDRI
jgi:hypothetical protein